MEQQCTDVDDVVLRRRNFRKQSLKPYTFNKTKTKYAAWFKEEKIFKRRTLE